MRNRQMIVNWLRAHTSAVEVRRRDGNTYFVMVDAAAFVKASAVCSREVQRIKGEGERQRLADLFETYGVHFDPSLRDEIVARVDRLQLPSYTGFVMPRLEARRDDRDNIVDVEISYPAISRRRCSSTPHSRVVMTSRRRIRGQHERHGRARCSRIVSRRMLRSTRSVARSPRFARPASETTDLTESNPTAVGFSYPGDLFDALSGEHVGRYTPQPLGLDSAREAVAADYARRGAEVDPRQVVLTASSSEAYSWLFKLLCDPGDSVLVPQPSYPLFEHLTRLESVQAIPYHLQYHGRWEIDFDSVSAAPANVRALLLVSPNNPDRLVCHREEARRLAEICRVASDGRSSPTKCSQTIHSTRSPHH